jgi:hypothetical protein
MWEAKKTTAEITDVNADRENFPEAFTIRFLAHPSGDICKRGSFWKPVVRASGGEVEKGLIGIKFIGFSFFIRSFSRPGGDFSMSVAVSGCPPAV